jgi:hypothetical protein
LAARRKLAQSELNRVRSPDYVGSLLGSLGADRLRPPAKHSNVVERPLAQAVGAV